MRQRDNPGAVSSRGREKSPDPPRGGPQVILFSRLVFRCQPESKKAAPEGGLLNVETTVRDQRE